jgi:hypothetical protein
MTTRLCDAAELFVDGDWIESKDQDPKGDVRLIQLADIGVGSFLNRSSRFLTAEKAKTLRCTYLNPGDVLIARMPDPIGRACVFPDLGQVCVTAVDVSILRPKSGVSAEYLVNWVNQPAFRALVTSEANGATRKRISRRKLEALPLRLPEETKQVGIVARIKECMERVEEIEALQRGRAQATDGLMRSIRRELLGSPDSLPSGWRECRLVSFPSGTLRRDGGPAIRRRTAATFEDVGEAATVANWRRVQCRQLFRLCLETVFFWVTLQLGDGPMSSQRLVARFMKQATGARKFATTARWIEHHYDESAGPVGLLQEVERALQGDVDQYAPAVMRGLAFCLMAGLQDGTVVERHDRLPLKRVRTEFEQRLDTKPFEFMRHILEGWVFAQHAYWSIGRGLADARARGKTILRLKVVLEDGGWTLTPGVASGSFPRPTADRLRTAISLAHECGFIDQVEI